MLREFYSGFPLYSYRGYRKELDSHVHLKDKSKQHISWRIFVERPWDHRPPS
jgi:hypothetical protein